MDVSPEISPTRPDQRLDGRPDRRADGLDALDQRIRLPEADADRSQDEEWFEFHHQGSWRRLRIHDYADLYSVPGLYETLVYDVLKCRSPRRVVNQLIDVLEDWPLSPEDSRVLDLGAGNGVVAERLREAGAEHVVGVDILPEAAEAARRDRPSVYDDYLVCDLTEPSEEHRRRLRDADFNCLVTVAALGFGDIPPAAFANAFNQISTPGWLAMSIKEDFLQDGDESGFAGLIRRMLADRTVRVEAHRRYCHRVTVGGRKLFYVALVARKLKDIAPACLNGGATRATMDRAGDGARVPRRFDASVLLS